MILLSQYIFHIFFLNKENDKFFFRRPYESQKTEGFSNKKDNSEDLRNCIADLKKMASQKKTRQIKNIPRKSRPTSDSVHGGNEFVEIIQQLKNISKTKKKRYPTESEAQSNSMIFQNQYQQPPPPQQQQQQQQQIMNKNGILNKGDFNPPRSVSNPRASYNFYSQNQKSGSGGYIQNGSKHKRSNSNFSQSEIFEKKKNFNSTRPEKEKLSESQIRGSNDGFPNYNEKRSYDNLILPDSAKTRPFKRATDEKKKNPSQMLKAYSNKGYEKRQKTRGNNKTTL